MKLFFDLKNNLLDQFIALISYLKGFEIRHSHESWRYVDISFVEFDIKLISRALIDI